MSARLRREERDALSAADLARSGFDPKLVELPAERGVRLLTPDDMFDPALDR